MFISLASVPDPESIWAKWGTPSEDVAGTLFLHFGQDLCISLSAAELLTLELVIAEAIDATPVRADHASA
jgi:hypothetical protein